jgi:transcriptional regulator with XRE-family HTH domain
LPSEDDLGAAEMVHRVAAGLRDRRKSRGMSLDELAVASGVSRAALSQIETHKTNPSLAVLWKIAVGLHFPFFELLCGSLQGAAVLRRDRTQALHSSDRRVERRALTQAGACPWLEAHELRLAPRASHRSDAHAAGTRELLVVLNGQLRVRVGSAAHDLDAGDSISFLADQPHTYENPGGGQTRCHDIVIYAR